MAKLRVGVVSPEREVWSGEADMVIAKTLEGELGILAGHAPVLGALDDGAVVRIQDESRDEIRVAVYGGFVSVTDDGVSVLAENAALGSEVDIEATRDELRAAESGADTDGDGTGSGAASDGAGHEGTDTAARARRARARLRAAGQDA